MDKMANKAGITKGFASMALVAVAVALTGCGGSSSSGHQRAAGVGGSLLKDKADMVKLKDLVTQTTTTLNDLIGDPQRDLKPQYKAFSSAVNKVDSMAKKTRERSVAIQASLDKYVDAWRDEVVTIQDVTLKEQALDRVAQAKESFKRLYGELNAFKEALAPYVGSLKDIQRYLDTDLTPAGLKTVQAMAAKATASDKDILRRIDGVVVELDRVATELTAGQQKTVK
jgi:hypothetical protein